MLILIISSNLYWGFPSMCQEHFLQFILNWLIANEERLSQVADLAIRCVSSQTGLIGDMLVQHQKNSNLSLFLFTICTSV
jgi:hypothetical protein